MQARCEITPFISSCNISNVNKLRFVLLSRHSILQAWDGRELLAELHRCAEALANEDPGGSNGVASVHMAIAAAAGVGPKNARDLANATGLRHFHSGSALAHDVAGLMEPTVANQGGTLPITPPPSTSPRPTLMANSWRNLGFRFELPSQVCQWVSHLRAESTSYAEHLPKKSGSFDMPSALDLQMQFFVI